MLEPELLRMVMMMVMMMTVLMINVVVDILTTRFYDVKRPPPRGGVDFVSTIRRLCVDEMS